MARFSAILFVVLATAPVLASPASAVAAALADAQQLPPQIAQRTRYLSTYAIPDGDRDEFLKVLAFHVNSLSREADLVQPRQAGPDLWAFIIDDYGWRPEVWEKLATVDPFFHVQLEVAEVVDYGTRNAQGVWVKTRSEKTGKKIKQPAAAPWVNAAQAAALIALTQSQAPVLRADWFFAQTAVSEDRVAGYYDFLEFKDRAAFDKAVALDVAAAKRVRKEIAAVIAKSGVALNNRQAIRFQSITGPYWITLDAKRSDGKSNALRFLDGDFVHDAEEIYGTLPNGLPAYFASDAKGVAQKTVPDTIASDGTAHGNDRRIHTGKSCITCHTEVIRPLNDSMRQIYRGDIKLQAPDYAKLLRLRQLYLRDIDAEVLRDQRDYAATIKNVNGLTPAANARAYGRAWDWYIERERTLVDCAAELGCTPERLTQALKASAKATGQLDPVLASLLQNQPLPIRQEQWEEIYGTAATILLGVR